MTSYLKLIARATAALPFSIVDSGVLAYDSATSFTVPDVAADDQLFIWVASAGGSGAGAAAATCDGDAMTEVYSEFDAGNAFRPRLTCLRHKLAETDDSATASITSGTGEQESICWAVIRGLDPTTPVPVVGTYGSTGPANPPAVTTTAAGQYVLAHYGTQSPSFSAHGAVAGYTIIEDQGANNRGQSVQFKLVTTAGSEDPPALGTSSSNDCGIAIALAAA